MDKEKIVVTTFNLVTELGLEGFSIGKLSKKLNCTKSSIYNYFESKDDLLNCVMRYLSQQITNSMTGCEDPVEQFKQHAKFVFENKAVFGFFHMYRNASFVDCDTIEQLGDEQSMADKLVEDLYTHLNGKKPQNFTITRCMCYGPLFSFLLTSKKTSNSVSQDDLNTLIDAIINSIKKEI